MFNMNYMKVFAGLLVTVLGMMVFQLELRNAQSPKLPSSAEQVILSAFFYFAPQIIHS
ncbi:hypothetical protein P692DRAFT_20593481 [Suillus brevipes Sb2]|nr:hypothetical protein P692DRAFT_20593481 [Suillus brevipes Sb2]